MKRSILILLAIISLFQTFSPLTVFIPRAQATEIDKRTGIVKNNAELSLPETMSEQNSLDYLDWSTLDVSINKQFEETSYYLKDVQFIDQNIGWAVGTAHWDQNRKKYTGTVIKTVDGGESWNAQEVPTDETLRGVCFVDENNGYAVGTNGTILHTSDGGKIWTKQSVDTLDEFRGVVFTDKNNGWATSIRPTHYDWLGYADDWQGSIWHTADGGQTWNKQSLPENASLLNRIEFVDANNGWAVGIRLVGYDYSWPIHNAVIYHTSDRGLTWQEQYAPSLEIVFTGIDFVDAQHGWVVGFRGNSGVEGGTVFRTGDGGITWERLEMEEMTSAVLWDVHFVDTNRGYLVGTLYGAAWGPPVLRTLDGGDSWDIPIMEDNDGEGLYAVTVSGDRAIAVGDHDYVAISNNPWGEYEWPHGENLFTQKYLNTHYRFEDVFFADEQHGWVVGKKSYQPALWGQVILATEDAGVTWETQYEHAPPLDKLFSFDFRLDKVFFLDSQTGWALGGSESFYDDDQGWVHHGAILHTSDGGQHWEEQGSDLYASWDLEFFSVYPLDHQNAWAIANRRFPEETIFFAHTTNGGVNWEWVDTGIEGSLGVGFADVQGDVTFSDALNGWATGGLGKIIHTADGGITWQQQTLPSQYTRCYAIEFLDNQIGWIAGEGLYYTVDSGAHWNTKEIGMEGDIHDIQFVDLANGWLAGVNGAVSYSADGGETWLPLKSGTAFSLRGVHFISPEKGWIVGDGGTILSVHFGSLTFSDVPFGHWAYEYIEKLHNADITEGCKEGMYCPDDTVTRGQMAVFLGRGIHGKDFVPPTCSGKFADVSIDHWACSWIEQFYNDGITKGCSDNPVMYCPDQPVTRAEMAIFLLRARYGSSYAPPEATGLFTDAPSGYWAADWVEQLYAEEITTGCGDNPLRFCPDESVTRAQMAAFLVRTFGL